jgi:hypothetical protein
MNQTATTKKNHWDDIATRTNATLAFANHLKDNPSEVPKCKKDSDYAKKTFANGYFYLEGETQDDPSKPLRPIPKETMFRVYEFEPRPERDKLVTLVLPDPKAVAGTVAARDIWLCSWSVWFTFTSS